jgi:anti-sigma regulatory factor (Ser/Thr protein kinase)
MRSRRQRRPAARARRWPPVSVCGDPEVLQPQLAPVPVHPDREGAMAEVVLSSGVGPRREVQVDHGPHGPSQARAAVQGWAADIGLGLIGDDVLLIVSELVTNAVRYGKPPVCVSVRADEQTVTVGVSDAASERPAMRTADDDAESGRGLLLMSLLSAEFGVRPAGCGKVVWARLPRS